MNCNTKKSIPVKSGKNLQDVGAFKKKLLLLFYDDSSVEAFDHDTGKLLYSKTTLPSNLIGKYNQSSVLLVDDTGFYQIRNGKTEAVLMHIDAASGEGHIIMEMPYHLNNMALRNDILYIACQLGYSTYHTATGVKTHHRILKSNDYKNIHTDINGLVRNSKDYSIRNLINHLLEYINGKMPKQ